MDDDKFYVPNRLGIKVPGRGIRNHYAACGSLPGRSPMRGCFDRSACSGNGLMAGAPMKSAYAIRNLLTAALAMEAEKICAAWGLGRFAFTEEPGIFNFDLFEEPDWERLARLASEPVDLQAWQAWAQERGTFRPAR